MVSKVQHINLGSKIYQEPFTISWRIKGFNTMPFLENHPVCGPWFMLGKKRDSTWSLLMTKQVHNGVKNIGFKLVRAEDETMWDMATFSLGVKIDDGRFISCIDKQVVGKESDNPYVFLVCPTTSGSSEMAKKSSQAQDPLNFLKCRELVHIENVNSEKESTGVKGFTNVDNGHSSEVLSGVKGSTNVEDSHCSEGSSGLKGSTHAENGIGSEESSGVKESTNVENGRSLEGSVVVNGSTTLKNGRDSEGPAGVNGSTVENGRRSDEPVVVNGSTNADNDLDSKRCSVVNKSGSFENSRGLSESTKPNACSIEDDKSDTRPLTPKELFQQKNITVVCIIEYTYMMYDPIHDPEMPDNSDLIDTFRDLYTSGKFSDITLKCEEVHFLCHKAILCTRSPLFQEFVDRGQSEMVLNLNLDLTTAKALLLYVYTGEFDDENIETDEECKKLCKAAEQFGLPNLRKLCLEILGEVADEVECVFVEKSSEIKLDQTLSLLSICSRDDSEAKKASVDEEIPVTNIGTQTSTSS